MSGNRYSGSVTRDGDAGRNYYEGTAQRQLAPSRHRVGPDSIVNSSLVEAGGTVMNAPTDVAGGRRAVISDPDGHRIELFTPTGGAIT